MKKFRSILSALLLCAMLAPAALTACSQTGDEPKEESSVSSAEVSASDPAASEISITTVGETDSEESGVKMKSKNPVKFAFHDGADANTRAAVEVVGDTRYGMRFGATAPFTSVSASCPSYGNNIGKLTLSLYAWSGNYYDTVAAEPIASKQFVNFNDNATLTLDFDEQPAGEYLFLLSDGEDGVGIWMFSDTASGTYLYNSGLESTGAFTMWIQYTYTPEKLYSEVTSMLDLSKVVTTPDPVVYPDDHPIYTLDAKPGSWVCTDGLGRTLSENKDVGDVRQDRFVGMFFWTWHSGHSHNRAINVTKLMEQHPEAQNDFHNVIWDDNTTGAYHWNEPVYGYYNGKDPWVYRKQAELLANAGVDVVIFDNTNGTFTWREGYSVLLETFAKAREDGVKTPQIAFLLPFGATPEARTQLRSLYTDIYRDSRYQDLWFYWDGKPLIMAYKSCLDTKDPLDSEIRSFFTFKAGQPVYNAKNRKNSEWGWLSVYPQTVYSNKDGTPEMTTVGVAQNWSAELGLTAMNGKNIFGRTYTSKGYDTRENAKLYGANFEEQWEYALEIDPEFVFVTGWNEWVAGRYETWQGVENAFPDQFNDTFSRDIEPSTGDLKDHYYYQLCEYIRRYKGTAAIEKAGEKKTIDIAGGVDQWDSVTPQYRAYQNNTFDRDCDGYGELHYTNTTGRNDIVSAKVSRDDEYLYFLVQTKDALTSESDNAWMRLFIDTEKGASSWESFDIVVGRTGYQNGSVDVERSSGGWNWTKTGTATYTVNGNALQVKIPRSALGLDSGAVSLSFKWSDNMQSDGDIMDFYVNGDVAPSGRFKYAYRSDN